MVSWLLAQGGEIDRVLNHPALEEMGDLVGNGNRDVDLGLVRCGAQMRGANHILSLQEGMVCRGRLVNKDVQGPRP